MAVNTRVVYVLGTSLLLLLVIWSITSPPSALLSIKSYANNHGATDSSPSGERPGEKAAEIVEALKGLPSGHAVSSSSASSPKATGTFNEMKFAFQDDLKYANPTYDVHELKKLLPHNYAGPGNPTYALYLSSRNGTMHDPYFQAAQQMTYRLLWDPKSKSKKYPLTIFVAPFIPDEQRDLLSAAGASVRELELVDWQPTVDIWARWRDLFSKLNIWAQTDFSRVAFLDLDAFPLKPIDQIFDLAEPQRCRKELLPVEDQPYASEICDFVFAGTEIQSSKEINVGVMVLQPNEAMHRRLIREATHTENFDNGMAEQAFLNYAFKHDGPFPTQFLEHKWNGFFPQEDEKGKLNIIHEKLWMMDNHWADNLFNETWQEMLEFYDSSKFRRMRFADGARLL